MEQLSAYKPPVRDRRVVVEFRDNRHPPLIIGAISATVRRPLEFMTLEHPTLGTIACSLIRVMPALVWYREVMRDAATNDQGGKVQFNPSQE